MGERQLDKLEVTGSSPVPPIEPSTASLVNVYDFAILDRISAGATSQSRHFGAWAPMLRLRSGQPREEFSDSLELGVAEVVVERRGSRPLQAWEVGKEITVDTPAVRDDNHLSSVGGVEFAMDESAFLEPVDHAGDGTGGESGERGKPSCGRGPVEKQEA